MAAHSKVSAIQVKKYHSFLISVHVKEAEGGLNTEALKQLISSNKVASQTPTALRKLEIIRLISTKGNRRKSVEWISSHPTENMATEVVLWLKRANKQYNEKKKATDLTKEMMKTKSPISNDSTEQGILAFNNEPPEEKKPIIKDTPEMEEMAKQMLIEEEYGAPIPNTTLNKEMDLKTTPNRPYKKFSFLWGLIYFEKG